MPYTYHIKNYLDKTLERIKSSIFEPLCPLEAVRWLTDEPVPFEDRFSGERMEIAPGQTWGKLWDCAWFNFKGKVPENAEGKNIVLLIDLSGEACVVDAEGCPVQGLTTFASDFASEHGRPGKRVVRLYERAKGGETVDIWVDAGCNDLFGKYRDSGILKEACIAVCNTEMEQLYYDFEVLYDLAQKTPPEKALHHEIMFSLDEAAHLLKYYNKEEAEKARRVLAKTLGRKGGDSPLTVTATGHSHIDLAWLWPIRETIRKGARTFSTVLKNMERYPDYIFGSSQPQLYQWMKDYYPGLYGRIKEKIAEGRWEVQGAMWVEADTNITGGESLVRQILYGKKFFMEEFGIDVKSLWLPDVFGYTGSLPQLLKKSGVDYFMTIKLSWNKVNVFPHHTFLWQGIDGSKVLAHMPPENNYLSSATPGAILKAERNYADKGAADEFLMLFGIGDGGGGPGEEHLERLKRERDLYGLLPVRQEHSARFFERLSRNCSRYRTWQGELYLETHQGTYTTQARSKRYNRKLENSLRELEFLQVLSSVLNGTEHSGNELEAIWKELLLYQFHDILPGSSIKRVYDESLARYDIILNRVNELIEEEKAVIAGSIDTEGFKKPVAVFNSLSWEREEWIRADGAWIKVRVPPMGFTVAEADAGTPVSGELAAYDNIIENSLLRVAFNEAGHIISIYDRKNDREVLGDAEPGNVLRVYEDEGDAWDFAMNYRERSADCFRLESSQTVIDGPCLTVRQEYSYNKSRLVQRIVLTEGSGRIDFITEVDWNERGKMLRTSFNTGINTDTAVCDIQFGNIRRPVHSNTSWDAAKYEICAHKWVDISRPDYGVALLNDCKYGHYVKDGILDLNLLRSTSKPGENADAAHHEFTYSLFPHKGDHVSGGVVREGYALNIPLLVRTVGQHTGGLRKLVSFFETDAENIVIETVKIAENNDDIVLRLYECHGAAAKARIKTGFPFKSARLVDLIERDIESDAFDEEAMVLTFKPFEVHTLRFEI